MKSTMIWFLTGLNLLLAAVLIVRVMPINAAHAQGMRPSEYLLVPGQTNGLAYSIVYVVDITNGTLGGMAYDESARGMKTMPALDLNRVFAAGPKGAANGKPGYK